MNPNEQTDSTSTNTAEPNIRSALGVDKLKMFAGIQISIGVVCITACTVGLITSTNKKPSCCHNYLCVNNYGYLYGSSSSSGLTCIDYTSIMILYGTCVCLSLWYLLTGIFPLCMTDSRKLRWKCLVNIEGLRFRAHADSFKILLTLKITFLVLSIISAVVFCPAMLSIGLLSVFIVDDGDNGYIVAVSAIIDTCAAIEMIVSITSATYCCCCSQMLPNNQQTVVIFNPVQERVIHTVTHLQGPNVNQNGVLYPQGYQQQYYMTNPQGQMMPWQFPGQVLHGPESQQHSGMSNANSSQQPWHIQPGSEQQAN